MKLTTTIIAFLVTTVLFTACSEKPETTSHINEVSLAKTKVILENNKISSLLATRQLDQNKYEERIQNTAYLISEYWNTDMENITINAYVMNESDEFITYHYQNNKVDKLSSAPNYIKKSFGIDVKEKMPEYFNSIESRSRSMLIPFKHLEKDIRFEIIEKKQKSV